MSKSQPLTCGVAKWVGCISPPSRWHPRRHNPSLFPPQRTKFSDRASNRAWISSRPTNHADGRSSWISPTANDSIPGSSWPFGRSAARDWSLSKLAKIQRRLRQKTADKKIHRPSIPIISYRLPTSSQRLFWRRARPRAFSILLRERRRIFPIVGAFRRSGRGTRDKATVAILAWRPPVGERPRNDERKSQWPWRKEE